MEYKDITVEDIRKEAVIWLLKHKLFNLVIK